MMRGGYRREGQICAHGNFRDECLAVFEKVLFRMQCEAVFSFVVGEEKGRGRGRYHLHPPSSINQA